MSTYIRLNKTNETDRNSILYSEDFDNNYWNKFNVNTTGNPAWVNVEAAPNGTLTADKLIASTQNNIHEFRAVVPVQSLISNIVTASIYVKGAELTQANLIIRGSSSNNNRVEISIDLTNGDLINVSSFGTFNLIDYTIENVGNDWYRISVKTKIPNIEANAIFKIQPMVNGNNVFAGNNSDGIFVWGANLTKNLIDQITTKGSIFNIYDDIEITVDDSYGVITEGNIQDIRDLNTLSGSNTKTLIINGTKTNNKILGQLFNINLDINSTFDLLKKQECELINNNKVIMKGFLQIQNIQYVSKFNYIYEVIIFDEQVNLFLEIEEKFITGNENKNDDLDFSDYEKQTINQNNNDLLRFTWDNVNNSFLKGPLDQPYVFLLFDNERNQTWNVDDYKVGFYVESLYREIFAKHGYTIESDFFETQLFKDLVIPFATSEELPTVGQEDVDNESITIHSRELDNEQIDWAATTIGGTGDQPQGIGGLSWPTVLPTEGKWTSTNFYGYADYAFQKISPSDVIPTIFPNIKPAQRSAIPPFIRLNQTLGGNINSWSNINNNDFIQTNNLVSFPSFNIPTHNVQLNGNYNYSFRIPYTVYVRTDKIVQQLGAVPDPNSKEGTNIRFKVSLMRIRNELDQTLPLDNYICNPNYVEEVTNTIVDTGDIWPALPWVQQGYSNSDVKSFINGGFNANGEVGYQYFIKVNLIGINYVSGPKIDTESICIIGSHNRNITEQVESVLNIELVETSTVGEGSRIILNDWLPQIKQKDFLKGINTMFNLKWMPIPQREKTIKIEPRDSFYAQGDIINLNQNDNFYLDNTVSKYSVLTEFQNRETILKYSDESSDTPRELVDYSTIPEIDGKGDLNAYLQGEYKKKYKREYGEQRILFDNENNKNSKIIETFFTPGIVGLSTKPNPTIVNSYITTLISARKPKNDYKVLFKNVLFNGSPNVQNGARSLRTFYNATNYPWDVFFPSFYCTATHLQCINDPYIQLPPQLVLSQNKLQQPLFDLNFGRVKELLFKPRFLTDNNLYNSFYLNTVRSYNEDKMITVSGFISNEQYQKLKYNTILYITKNEFNGYFIINKIVEYNVKNCRIKLELITYDLINLPDYNYTINPGTDDPVDPDKDPVMLKENSYNVQNKFNIGQDNSTSNGSINIGNNSITQIGSINIGNNNYAQTKSIVIGDNSSSNKEKVIILDDNYNYKGDKSAIISQSIIIDEIIAKNDELDLVGNIKINGEDIFKKNVGININRDIILEDDNVLVFVNNSNVLITLPRINNNNQFVNYVIKNNNVTSTRIIPFENDVTIDNNTQYIIQNNFDNITIVNNGQNWFII